MPKLTVPSHRVTNKEATETCGQGSCLRQILVCDFWTHYGTTLGLFLLSGNTGQVWWLTPVTLALERLRQEVRYNFKTTLGYMVSGQLRLHRKILSIFF